MLYLVAAGLSGAAVDIVMTWQVAPFMALATAPFVGSLAAGIAGLALHWLRPADDVRDHRRDDLHEQLDTVHTMDTDAMVSALRGAAELGRREPERRVVPVIRDQRRRTG